MTFITRFAPSPTGKLHLGHAYSALVAFDAARKAGGQFILRIEDIDRERCRPEFETAIKDDLEWLGIKWSGAVRRQSDHLHAYQASMEQLIAGELVYRCFKTRKEIADEISRAPHGAPGSGDDGVFIGQPLPHSEENALLAEGQPFAWRLSIDAARRQLGHAFDTLTFQEWVMDEPIVDEFRIDHLSGGSVVARPADPARFGDVILGRKDSGVSYHIASVHDDAAQKITHIIRGEDLAEAAHLHVLLQELLGLPKVIYRHHRLIMGDDGKRLAKRDKSKTLEALREAGWTPEDVRRALGLSP